MLLNRLSLTYLAAVRCSRMGLYSGHELFFCNLKEFRSVGLIETVQIITINNHRKQFSTDWYLKENKLTPFGLQIKHYRALDLCCKGSCDTELNGSQKRLVMKRLTICSRATRLSVSVQVVPVCTFQKPDERSQKPYKPDGWHRCLAADRQVTAQSVPQHVWLTVCVWHRPPCYDSLLLCCAGVCNSSH